MIHKEKVLIMIRDKKSGNFLDQTDQVAWYSEDNNSIRVKFTSSDNFYYKSYRDMKIYDEPKIVNDYQNMYFNGHRLSEVRNLVKFGEYYKIFYYSGKTSVYHVSECGIITKKTSSKHQWILRFNYYKELAKLNAVDSDFLDSQYNMLNINKETTLYKYLNKSNVGQLSTINTFIYPFGLNLSQKKAVEKAFEYDVSFIEGPPGTGKTQTILNIIANAVYHKKSIAVVSNNNTAIENVKEKLTEYNFDFLTALLGNKGNKQAFFEEEINKEKPVDYLSMNPTKLLNNELLTKVMDYKDILPQLYQLENDLATLKNIILNLKTEYNYFRASNPIKTNQKLDNLTKKVKTSDRALYLKMSLSHLDKLRFIDKVKLRFSLKTKIKKLSDDKISVLTTRLNHKYYQLQIKELERDKNILERRLEKEDFVQAKSRYERYSMQLFKNRLSDRYRHMIPSEFNYRTYRYNFEDFINEYPVILSTSYALIPSAESGFVFDYLIIDEASQTDLLSSLLALSCAKNIVIVGDTKQLPHIESHRLKEINRNLMKTYNIQESYNYLKHNILTSALEVFPHAPKTLLREHYRCHPKIINYCNQKYYNNELVILTKDYKHKHPLNIIKTVPGNHARTNPNGSGQYNQREIDEIISLIPQIDESSIGVITPFRIQADKLKEAIIHDQKLVEVDTVHKFQGRAKDVVILSTVANDIRLKTKDSEKEDFISRNDLLNVAVSRAKKQLHLIVSHGIYNSKNNVIADLVKYIEYHSEDSVIKEGKIKSIYDMLYGSQKKALETFRKKYYKTEYDSENLTLKLIEEIIEENNLNNLTVALHSPLDDLISSYKTLSDEEVRYVKHHRTHIDFLIYNQLTKEPVLVIEVDGIHYHEQNKKQRKRDLIKDKVLKLNNIQLLRLKTNESHERDRIIGAINLQQV